MDHALLEGSLAMQSRIYFAAVCHMDLFKPVLRVQIMIAGQQLALSTPPHGVLPSSAHGSEEHLDTISRFNQSIIAQNSFHPTA